jgi:hypothetical protein
MVPNPSDRYLGVRGAGPGDPDSGSPPVGLLAVVTEPIEGS